MGSYGIETMDWNPVLLAVFWGHPLNPFWEKNIGRQWEMCPRNRRKILQNSRNAGCSIAMSQYRSQLPE